MIFNILLTLFFVFLNAFFVAAEFAIVKVRSSQIELRIRGGSKLASLTKNIMSHLDAYLSATQLGITLASLGLGWIGESVVAGIIIDIIHFFGLSASPQFVHSISLPLAFSLITVLHIVFGELAPKSLAIQRPEQVALVIGVPLKLFYLIFRPVIWMLNGLANSFIKLLGISPMSEESELHSAEELRYLLEESSKSGIINTSDHELIENVFEFTDTPVKQIMVPHNRIVAFDISTPPDDIMFKFISEGYSRMPVYADSIDNIIGVVYAKDFISLMGHKELIIIEDILRPAAYIAEEEKINVLLRKMQKDKIHMAVVVDEFGGTAGIVTLEDILEELVGEIQDEYDEEIPDVEKIGETEFLVQASAVIADVNESLPVPLPESEDYETVGGLVMHAIGRIPEIHEIIELDRYTCLILKRSDRKIERVKLTLSDKKTEDNDELSSAD